MSGNLAFFAAATYPEDYPRNFVERAVEEIEGFLSLGRRATIIDPKALDGKILVTEWTKEETKLQTALKIVAIVLGFIFVAPIKLALRAVRNYHVVQPQELAREASGIGESNLPAEQQHQLERKKRLLTDAYSIAMFKLGATLATPDKELAATIGEILSQYAIVTYRDETVGENRFAIAKQILLGALHAELYAAGVFDTCCDFSVAKKLQELPATILDSKPFEPVEALFFAQETEAIYDGVRAANLTCQQRIVLCQTLRYINGAERHRIDWKEKRLPNESEKEFFKKLLHLAEKVIMLDSPANLAEMDPAALRELWELRYNDFPYFYEKVTQEEAKGKELPSWLYDACILMPETLLGNISRIATKFAKTLADYETPWKLLKTSLWQHLEPETAANLEDVMEHEVCTPEVVNSVVKQLAEIREADFQLLRFAKVPSNMAYAMIRENPESHKKTEGLLNLAKGIVDLYAPYGIARHHFESVRHNYYLLNLLKSLQMMEEILTTQLENVKGNKKSVDVSLKQLEKSISHTMAILVESGLYQGELKTLQQLADDWNKSEAKDLEGKRVILQSLIERGLTFARDLSAKASPIKDPRN